MLHFKITGKIQCRLVIHSYLQYLGLSKLALLNPHRIHFVTAKLLPAPTLFCHR